MPRAPSRVVERTLTFPGERVRLGVVADTHSNPHPDAARWLAARAPDHLLHAGDIGNERVLDELAKIAPVTAVRGNIDGASYLPETIALTILGGGFSLVLLLTHIAVYGPRLRPEVARAATKAGAVLVVCGHSHVPFLGRDKGIATFNPGSIGPRRFQLPIAFGVIDVRAGGVTFEHVDCETGERWAPAARGAVIRG